MRVGILVFGLLALVSLGRAYHLTEEWKGKHFFDNFDFFTDSDPTHGFVDYVDQQTAIADGLIGLINSSVYIGADHTNISSGAG
jgi:hypothetical protein